MPFATNARETQIALARLSGAVGQLGAAARTIMQLREQEFQTRYGQRRISHPLETVDASIDAVEADMAATFDPAQITLLDAEITKLTTAAAAVEAQLS